MDMKNVLILRLSTGEAPARKRHHVTFRPLHNSLRASLIMWPCRQRAIFHGEPSVLASGWIAKGGRSNCVHEKREREREREREIVRVYAFRYKPEQYQGQML